ncbi:MAG: YciI family protein, partial [Pseudomonadota bacterium]|nr:YciI family protein [Pseudomonadota bacterium]
DLQYIIRSFDKSENKSIRLANREKHVEYVKNQSVKLLLAGPLVNDQTGDPIGTLLIVEADERSDVENYAENDPYNKAGLFKETQITAINITVANLS